MKKSNKFKQAISFYTFYFFSWLLAMLPLKVLYGLSYLGALILYHIVRYRRKTVALNLKNSFPERSRRELKKIELKYYLHLSDLFIEFIYQLHRSPKVASRLCEFKNIELLNSYYDKGKSVIVAGGHYGNWEILGMLGSVCKHITFGIYKPLENKYYEKYTNKAREKFGGVTLAMQDTFKTAISYHQQGKLFFLGLISDQTPGRHDIHYWTTFLNQDTPVFLGVEKIARKLDQPVFFCNMRKIKRGKYVVEFELLCDNPKNTQPYEITELHVRALERLILKAPEYWLWSHRRWKYKRKDYQNN